MLENIISYIVETVAALGYLGIFVLMFLESSFFPFPSEVVMVPAGYLAFKGEMDLTLVILFGILGSLGGALFNYYLAVVLGRPFLHRYGRYILISEETLTKMENFFKTHGSISTFSGRLIPGVRQYISLPAGLARMNLMKFSIYTSLGAGIWVTILALIGYFIGSNEALVKEYVTTITLLLLGSLVLLAAFYIWRHKRKEG
jgi:membrane protein DedA with SNARE-associated domain